MSKRRSGRNGRTRDRSQIANSKLRSSSRSRDYKFPDLTRVQDFRRFRPDEVFYVSRNFDTTRSRISSPRVRVFEPAKKFRVPLILSFDYPKRVILCVRRKVRKEVLHALRKTGKGGQKRPRRTPYSNVRCGG